MRIDECWLQPWHPDVGKRVERRSIPRHRQGPGQPGRWIAECTLYSGGQNDDFLPLTYTLGGGAWGQGQICDILRPQLAMNRFLPLWPHRFPHFAYIHLGGGGALILDRCRAFDLFASVDAHLRCTGTRGWEAG